MLVAYKCPQLSQFTDYIRHSDIFIIFYGGPALDEHTSSWYVLMLAPHMCEITLSLQVVPWQENCTALHCEDSSSTYYYVFSTAKRPLQINRQRKLYSVLQRVEEKTEAV